MIKKLSGIFPKRHSKDIQGPILMNVSQEQFDMLDIFSHSIDIFSTLENEEEKAHLLENLIQQFKQTFDGLDKINFQVDSVRKSVNLYCNCCGEIGHLILSNSELSIAMFNTIVFSYRSNSAAFEESDFLPMFSGLIDFSKENPDVLQEACEMIGVLFQSKPFFDQFANKEGFSKIFNTYYLTKISDYAQDLFLHILYTITPEHFYDFSPLQSDLDLFLETFDGKFEGDYSRSQCTLFIIHFLISFTKFNPDLFTRFDDMHGFYVMNHFLLDNCTDIISQCYSLLISSSKGSQSIMMNLCMLYQLDKTTPQLRAQVIKILHQALIVDKIFKIDSILNVGSLGTFILTPPLLDREGYILLALFLKGISEAKMTTIKGCLYQILQIITPSCDQNIPIDSYLELIETAINQNELQPIDLLENKFLEDFILVQQHENLAQYFDKHLIFSFLVIKVYNIEESAEFRFPVARAFIAISSMLSNVEDFLTMLKDFVNVDFSEDLYSLLLAYINNQDILDFLIKETQSVINTYNYFVDLNGFQIIEDFLKEHPERAESIVKLLVALSYVGPRKELNNWLIDRPKDDPIFKLDRDFLGKAVYAFRENTNLLHIPALLPFCNDFDSSSPLNLYLAGKYGIASFFNQGVEIPQIPNFLTISNRFINPDVVQHLMKYPSIFKHFINIKKPQFALFEFVPHMEKAYITIDKTFATLSFFVQIPDPSKEPIPILTCSTLKILSVEDTLIIKGKEIVTVDIKRTRWNHIFINTVFKTKPGQPAIKRVNVLLRGKTVAHIKPLHSHLPSLTIFGSKDKPLPASFRIAKLVHISEKPLQETDRTNIVLMRPYLTISYPDAILPHLNQGLSAYTVHFLGFASYFSDWVHAEKLFEFLERVTQESLFGSIFTSLVALQNIHNFDFEIFWNRMLTSVKSQKDILESFLLTYTYDFPVEFYKGVKKTRYITVLLKDLELFAVFSPDSVVELINKIKSNLRNNFDIKTLFDLDLWYYLRTGLDEKVLLAFVQFISMLYQENMSPATIQQFSNYVVSSCDWITSLPYSSEKYPIGVIMELSLPENTIHNTLMNSFMDLLRLGASFEAFTYNQLLGFMILFDDERMLLMADVIAIYSHNNPKFVKTNQLASAIFEKNATSKDVWTRAFAILTGTMPNQPLISTLRIARPLFLPVVIDMLTSLLRKIVISILKNVESPYVQLTREVTEKILTFPPEDYKYFYEQQCLNSLYDIINFGLIPQSLSTDKERVENNWISALPANKLSKDDLKRLSLVLDKDEPFSSLIQQYDFQSITGKYEQTIIKEFEEIPSDHKGIEWMQFSTTLSSLLSNILFSADASSFASILTELIGGTSLMYNEYGKVFGQELMFTILANLTFTEASLDYCYKPIFKIVSKFTRLYLFDDKYINLLYSIFNLIKVKLIKLHVEDTSVINSFRFLLLSSFIFVQKDNINEIFEIFIKFKEIVFNDIVFKDEEFSLIWLHLTKSCQVDTPEFILAMQHFMKVINNSVTDEYKAEDVENMWTLFKKKKFNSNDPAITTARMKRGKAIVLNTQQKLSIYSKEKLFQTVYRVSNLFIQSNSQMFKVNNRMRIYEKMFYDINKNKIVLKCQLPYECNSYHLALTSFPLTQSRVVSPTPYKLNSPSFGVKHQSDFFKLSYTPKPARIPQVETMGKSLCSPEWCFFHQEDELPFRSPFEYSKVIEQSPSMIKASFKSTFTDFGNIIAIFDVKFFFFTHPVETVLFISETGIHILVLAKFEDNDIVLFKEPEWPVAFLPFTESIAINEWHSVSLFCGHIVLSIEFKNVINTRPHSYLHKKVGMVISSLYNPDVIIIFNSHSDMESCDKLINKSDKKFVLNHITNYPFLFTINSVQVATSRWSQGFISNFDYLMLLNKYGGRSTMDLSQYPVFPWVNSPNLEPRDLSLPMGQLDKERAAHYDTTYECSDEPHYYYGFHYSLPGVVFWLLMRLPPFTYFQWDLNKGWDDSQRLFTSVEDAYTSASSANASDLKELIPEMYCVPEALLNINKLEFPEGTNEIVALPEWTGNNYDLFVESARMFLERSDDLNSWIDLIFGYKQSGEAAIAAKNVFLPTSYHTFNASNSAVDEQALEAQVLNFGQCPVQLFQKPHPSRSRANHVTLQHLLNKITFSQITIQNPRQLKVNNVAVSTDRIAYALPHIAVALPPQFTYYIFIDQMNEKMNISDQNTIILSINDSSFAFVSQISSSIDGMFVVLSMLSGRVDVFQIIYEQNKPKSVERISTYQNDASAALSSVLLSRDYICATYYRYKVILWNFATKLWHRTIDVSFKVKQIFFDDFNGVLTIVGSRKVIQYSINCKELREITFENRITCAGILPYEVTFDGRVFVFADEIGNVSFYVVDGSSYQLQTIGSKMIHKHKIIAMFVDPFKSRIVTTDIRGMTFITEVKIYEEESLIVCCAFCANPMTTKCKHCQVPLCNNCALDGDICPNCITELGIQKQSSLTKIFMT